MGGATCVTQPLTQRARVIAVIAQWPELEAHRSLLSQVQIDEQERAAYDRLSQVAAGRVERLLELLKQ